MNTEKKQKTVKTVSIMILATLLSKALGMLRSVLLASNYGTGNEAAAFSAASKIPLSFFDLLFSAAILGCFIPVYNSFGDERKKEASDFASLFINFVALATGLLSLTGILFADRFIFLIAPGLEPGTSALAAKLLRIMFPMIIFTGIAYTLVGVLQSKGRFILPALISSVSNAGVIVYFLFFDSALGDKRVYGLAAAYAISWFLQFITLAIPLIRKGTEYRLRSDFRNPVFRRALKMSLPIMLGSWLVPAGSLSGTFFSTFVSSNGNVVFDYANNVYIIIAGILTYSICNYIFPTLSRLSASDDTAGFADTVGTGLSSSIAVIIPFLSASVILSGEAVSVLYLRNDFSANDACLTSEVFRYIAIAMPAFSVIEIMSRAFYAKRMEKVPMAAALAGAVTNILSAAVFINVSGFGLWAVGLSNALGQVAAAAVLLAASRRKIPGLLGNGFLFNLLKILISGILSASAMLAVYIVIDSSPYEAGILKNIAVAAATFLPGTAIYLGMLRLFHVRFKISPKQEVIPD